MIITFEPAMSANEIKADFIHVSIARWLRWTNRTGWGSRIAVGRLLGRLLRLLS